MVAHKLAVHALVPSTGFSLPPIVLVHGAANSAGVWTFWQHELAARGWPTYAVDLRGHGSSSPMDLSTTTMEDYADDVEAIVAQLGQEPVLLGWSMGGLVTMMVATRGRGRACIGLAPSTPARSVDRAAPAREGVFGPEEYGLASHEPKDLDGVMPDLDDEERNIALASLGLESRLARDQRAGGIVLTSIPCPLLLLIGTSDSQWPEERYRDLWLVHDQVLIQGASHWGLVLSRQAVRTQAETANDWLVGRLALAARVSGP